MATRHCHEKNLDHVSTAMVISRIIITPVRNFKKAIFVHIISQAGMDEIAQRFENPLYGRSLVVLAPLLLAYDRNYTFSLKLSIMVLKPALLIISRLSIDLLRPLLL